MTDPIHVSAERWRTLELELAASKIYDQPLRDLVVDAVFRHEDGTELRRPVFWDGETTWRVRFAPTAVGRWSVRIEFDGAPDPLLATFAATIDAVPYSGEHELYRHGFLRVADSGRYLEHEDGTPFFYLGDTHWVLPHERLDESNAPGVDSQFGYMLALRAQQGFTVYQSEPIWDPHREWAEPHARADELPVADLSDGFGAADLPGFAQLDRKFAAIADAGLVHANAQVTWAKDPAEHPETYTEDFMYRMARYWVARYGSYPVIWTIAQEIDKDMYGAYTAETLGVWFAVGQALADTDAYGQVIMPHMENTSHVSPSTSTWKDKPWHHAFGAQVQDWDATAALEFHAFAPTRPTVAYECRYENFWTDARGAVASGYLAYQLGMCGYGYGVAGVWNDVYSLPEEEPDFGTDYELPKRYQWWYDGVRRETAARLTLLRRFYEERQWWRFAPVVEDAVWTDATGGVVPTADDEGRLTVFVGGPAARSGESPGVLSTLAAHRSHRVRWFDPRTGDRVEAGETSVDGVWAIPVPPTPDDWLLTVDPVG